MRTTRAVLAALGLQKLLGERRAELGERYGVELRARMGMVKRVLVS